MIDNDVYTEAGKLYILSKPIDVLNISIVTFMNKQIPRLFILPVTIFALDFKSRVYEAIDAMKVLVDSDKDTSHTIMYGVAEYDIPLLGEDSDSQYIFREE